VQPRAILRFDGDCGFCRRRVNRWRLRTGDAIDYRPFGPGDDWRAVRYEGPDGERATGAAAVLRTLAHAPGGGLGWLLYRRLPGFGPVSEACYRAVAWARPLLSPAYRLLDGPGEEPPGLERTRAWFLRALGLVYLAAFLSLWPQLRGLIGARGILPVAQTLASVAEFHGAARFHQFPTLLWLSSSDTALDLCVGGGVLCSLLVVCNLARPLALLGAWLCYLSLFTVGREFLSFQWDTLLLETGGLALLLAPRRLPPTAPLWLLRWLLFRLMFASGVVKLTSGDTSWTDLTALSFHWWTQPLPAWGGWQLAQLPVWFQKAACLGSHVVELIVPFLVFLGRRPRLVAFFAFGTLQLLIAFAGNYGFFNLLTLVLCIPLLEGAPSPAPLPRRTRLVWARRGVMAALLVLSCVVFARGLRVRVPWPAPVRAAVAAVEPFRLASAYGLFRVMTKQRREIELEGSDDGRAWKAYRFVYKPGRAGDAPRYLPLHMPRLDWRMWFLALGSFDDSPWFWPLMERLLEGSPEVAGLLAHDPFPDAPPRYLRAMVYDCRFTTREERRAGGDWWVRTPLGRYSPVLER